MKTLKKIIGLAMAMVMMAMSFAAYAETTEEHIHDGCCREDVQTEDSGVMPRGMECPNCGRMTLSYHKLSETTRQVSEACTHGIAGGLDVYTVTTITYNYSCSNCGYNTGRNTASSSRTLTYCPKS